VKIRALVCAGIVAAVFAAPARAADKTEDLAQVAGESWLKLTDAGDGGAAWEQGSKLLKAQFTKEAWTQLGGSALASLGRVVSRKLTSRQQPEGAPDGKYMTIQYETAFQKKTSAVETVTLTLDPDGVWRVMGYVIN
jgi:hypothetical protein